MEVYQGSKVPFERAEKKLSVGGGHKFVMLYHMWTTSGGSGGCDRTHSGGEGGLQGEALEQGQKQKQKQCSAGSTQRAGRRGAEKMKISRRII